MLTRVLVCAFVASSRLTELAYSRHNINRVPGALEGAWSRRSYPLIVAVHTIAIACPLLFGKDRRAFWLLLLFAVQPLRLWVLLTLKGRWNARGAVDPAMTVATDGPYAFIRHPNYTVVAIELLSLPMAFGLTRLAAGLALANGLLLALRVRDEEMLLEAVPGYREHFGSKPRFLPGFF